MIIQNEAFYYEVIPTSIIASRRALSHIFFLTCQYGRDEIAAGYFFEE